MNYSAKEDIIENIFAKIRYLIVPSKENNYKSKILQNNILLYCVVLIFTLKIFTIIISVNFPQNIFFADITKATLENFANQSRQSLGLSPLIENERLNQAAYSKAQNMISNNYFDHTSPQGISPWYWFLQAGYNYKYAGENLAIGFFDSTEVYNAWLNSPSHKANILNPNYKEVGTAVLYGFGPNNTVVVVQEFGALLPQKITATQKPETIKPETKPEVNTNTPASVTNDKEQVLSQETQSQVLQSPISKSTDNFYSKLLNFMLYNYNSLLQDIIYGVSLIITGILLAIIFLDINGLGLRKGLVFRSILIVVLLSTTALLNQIII